MIFVTVGAQLPFDRLITAIDTWAASTGRDDVFAQVGRTSNPPKHIRWASMLDPVDFRHHFWEAELIIAHAGAGTILTAMEMSKPLLVMPRNAAFDETRTNHQFATARAFQERTNLSVAHDEDELGQILQKSLRIEPLSRIGSYASPQLLSAVTQLIDTGEMQQPALRLVPADDAHAIMPDLTETTAPRRKAA